MEEKFDWSKFRYGDVWSWPSDKQIEDAIAEHARQWGEQVAREREERFMAAFLAEMSPEERKNSEETRNSHHGRN